MSKKFIFHCAIIMEPLQKSCHHHDFFAVKINGVGSEYYDPLLSVFDYSEKNSEEDYEAIVICAIEKLQLHKPPHPPSTAMRCLCNQSGCNVPEPLEEFLKFNRNVFPLLQVLRKMKFRSTFNAKWLGNIATNWNRRKQLLFSELLSYFIYISGRSSSLVFVPIHSDKT
ncbi:Protein CBG22734 [Caenorhabditis briggsae]|uniref:Protein CBG22734 n=1 Tax=Caenorhabditis briggsae TaxID=6238 RepID=A8Y321_CAEBR|nr:Protein CBG22734 [Caenorhabditis briggsae]CAP39258.1 Protein CBG22734 [Caenorhabditis briggsae]